MISANILLAFGLAAVAAGPFTETKTGTATTATLTSDPTTLLTATSDGTTLTTGAATTTTEEDTTTEAAVTTTAERPDSTQFNIYPNQGVPATGPLQARTSPDGKLYFNNPNDSYDTGAFVVNGRGRLVNGNELMCAFFGRGEQYGDIIGCPADETDVRYSPLDCELGASGQIDCQAQGKFCYYSPRFACDSRGVYPYFYIESAGASGYGLVLGSSGLDLTPVELAARPEPTEP